MAWRTDLHRRLDADDVACERGHRFVARPRLPADLARAATDDALHCRAIAPPVARADRPDLALLRRHHEHPWRG